MKDRSGRGGSFVIVRNCIERSIVLEEWIFFIFSLGVGRCTDRYLSSPSFYSSQIEQIERRGLGWVTDFFFFFLLPLPLFLSFFFFFYSSLSSLSSKSGPVGTVVPTDSDVPLMAVTHSRVAPVYTKLHSWPASVHNYQSPKHAVC